jgi:3-oxoacyl-[acyl-carrier protein] reductase
MEIDLKGKNAVVCGSTQGIGKATAIEFANLGADVTLIARNENLLKNVVRLLSSKGNQKHNYVAVDFSFPEELEVKIDSYVKGNPPVHILVNNCGGPKPGLAIDAEPGEFELAFKQHLICNQILVKALVPGMKNERYGRIINIISTSVKQPIRNLGVSNTIRNAVAGWSKTLANELAPFGITVNNVLPGATNTERLKLILRDRAKTLNISYEESEKRYKSDIPAGRFAEPEELASAIAFLASPGASYVNGINLPVDGGRLNSL